MSISAVTSAFANYAQKITGTTPSGGKSAAPSTALEEATETPVQTAHEAKNGDAAAIKIMRQLKQQQEQKVQKASSAPGKGRAVDTKA